MPLQDNYCPICDGESEFDQIADQVLPFRGQLCRKILYQCRRCLFLFTNEDRSPREKFFVSSSYPSEKTGHLTPREVDLAQLGIRLVGGSKTSSILVYGVGYNTTVQTLAGLGYKNVWGSDIADEVAYGEHVVNIAHSPDYFASRNIQFDVIVACEVWEHYSRHDTNDAFGWIFRHVSSGGIVIGTTSLWSACKSDDPFYNAPHEWGKRLLTWWTYPFFDDHASFYRADNLRQLGKRFGMHTGIGYFKDAAVENGNQHKRIVAFVPESCIRAKRTVQRHFDGRRHDVFFC